MELRSIYRCVLLLLFSVISPMSNAAFEGCSSSDGSWDWNKIDSYAGSIAKYPFSEDNYIGATITHDHCPEDGWLLYAKKLTCEDANPGSTVCENEQDRLDKRPNLPFFVLYNKYTGLLRYFVWITWEDNSSTENKDALSWQLSTVKYINATDKHPVLVNEENPLRPLDQFSPNGGTLGGQMTSVLTTPEKGVWAVLDYFVTYPGEDKPEDNLAFNLNVIAQSTQEIELSGKIEGKLSTHIPGTKRADNLTIAKTLWGEKATIKGAYYAPETWSEDVFDYANSLDDDSFLNAGGVAQLGADILNTAPFLGGINSAFAGYDIVKGLMGTKSTIKHQYIDLDVNMDGFITDDTQALKHINVSLHKSDQFNSRTGVDDSQLNFDGNIGLFHISDTPRLLLSHVQIDENKLGNGSTAYRLGGRLASDLKSFIKINPSVANEMVLDEIKVTPEFEMTLIEDVTPERKMLIGWDRGGPISGISTPYITGDLGFNFEFLSCPHKISYPEIVGGSSGSVSIWNVKNIIDQFMCQSPIKIDAKVSERKEKIELAYADIRSALSPTKMHSKKIKVSSQELLPPESGAPFLFDLRMIPENYNSAIRLRTGRHWGYKIDDVKFKVFLKFKHKNRPEDDPIFVDYVGYIDPAIKLCGGSEEEWNGHVFNGVLGDSITNYEMVDQSVCEGNFDSDNDGLTDIFEIQKGLSITDADTDDDGFNDGFESRNTFLGYDPKVWQAEEDVRSKPSGCNLKNANAEYLWTQYTGNAPTGRAFVSTSNAFEIGKILHEDKVDVTILSFFETLWPTKIIKVKTRCNNGAFDIL